MPGKLRQIADKKVKRDPTPTLLPVPKYTNPKSTMRSYKVPQPKPIPVPKVRPTGERGIYDNSLDVIRSLKGRGGVKSTSKD